MAKAFMLKLRARASARSGIHCHEFAWIKGTLSTLLLEDFVGASFGAMFFALTQEVWDISARLQLWSIAVLTLLSFSLGFILIYLSRRRLQISVKLEHKASLRALEIYLVSLATALMFVLVLQTAHTPILIFKQAVLIALPAVISAATADLLFF
ncbi:MAG: DUF2391 family protein [Nanoarchaeota archaeon]